MAETPLFRIRRMEPGDLDQALALSVSEGWNQTGSDWEFFLAGSKNVCIVAEKEGRVAGTATALVHDNKLAWIGMVLVDKSLRGMGAGRMLLEELIACTGKEYSLKLDATPAGEPLYTRLGFLPEYRIVRMTCDRITLPEAPVKGALPVPAGTADPGALTLYDSKIFGAKRAPLLSYLHSNRPDLALEVKDKGELRGFVMGRKGSRFTYLGPVVADDPDTALAVLRGALSAAGNGPAAVDIHEDREDMIQYLEAAGFSRQRWFTRMYLERNPYPGIPSRQYLISGPEFG